jgi:CBS domain-containing membrane protein
MAPKHPSKLGLRQLGAEHVRAFFQAVHLEKISRRYPPQLVLGIYVAVNGFFAIALMATVASITKSPFIFPSLGPTAYLLFFAPTSAAASPRHVILGHGIGIFCGWLSLALFGLLDAPGALVEGVNLPRIFATAFSLGATAGMMILFRVNHPPAGATTLIISLGILQSDWSLLVIELAVIAVVTQAWIINRLAGVPYPLWSPPSKNES